MNPQSFDFFIYDNYRTLLKDFTTYLKTQGRVFSYRWFSNQAGFSSPNFLKLVIDGQRDISSETIEKIIKVFKFSKSQGDFFRNLVHMNQAKTSEERQFYAERLVKNKGIGLLQPLQKSKFDYYNKWYHIPIREMLSLKDFSEDPHTISKRLKPKIRPDEASNAIETLLKLGLIEKASNGKLTLKEEHVSTGDNFTSASVAQFHKKMIQLAAESIDRFPRSEREISSSTISISKAKAQELKKLIVDFRKNLLKLSEEDKNKEEIYQINFQLFPLTQKDPGGEK